MKIQTKCQITNSLPDVQAGKSQISANIQIPMFKTSIASCVDRLSSSNRLRSIVNRLNPHYVRRPTFPVTQPYTVRRQVWVIGILNLFVICYLVFGISSGHAQESTLEEARDYIRKSQESSGAAINLYRQLIAKGEDLDRLHLELGQLYYGMGDFQQATEELKKSNLLEAEKILAISYYRLGDFTDAFEIFSKEKFTDDEYRYYYGLTCEKMNLFDQALGIYKKVKNKEFLSKASDRINLIEKQVALPHIRNIDHQVFQIIKTAPTEKKYPQAGALILYCDEKIKVNPQNTQVSYLHYIVKILNERGKESFSEATIEYDSTYEKVELEYARTIKPDGSVVEVGSRHIRDVSKYLNFPLYSNVRVYIISFPEITEGATIDYKIKIFRNQLTNKKDFVISYTAQTSDPIIAANFVIDLPKGKPVHLKTLNDNYNNFNANLSPSIKEKDNCLIYDWKFKDIPQILPESNMPPNVEINPSLLISTFNSWEEIYAWWWQLAKDKIRPDVNIKNKTRQLIKGLNTKEDKAKAIYNFCAQKIRYVAVEYGQAGYEPHQASDIFKNKYGDCKDQAILLVTMLKEAGLSAWPVLIPTKDCYNLNPDFASMLFNHCIAAVALGDRVIFLDPTAETCAFGDLPADDQGRRVLIIQEDRYKIGDTPLLPAKQNLVKQSVQLKINSDESITAKKTIFTYGIYDQGQRAWLLYTPPELIAEALKEKIQDASIGGRLENYQIQNLEDLNQSVVLDYAFVGPEYFTVAGKLRIMPRLAGLDTSLVAKDRRKYPIDFGILDIAETTFEIEIPHNLAIRYLPENVNENSPWLTFSAEYAYENGKLLFKQKKELKKNKVSQQEYGDFKNFFEGLAKKLKQHIVLERIQ